MAKTESNKSWIESFVELQLKDLRGGELTPEQRRFLTGIEMTGLALPGALEEELLKHSLSEVPAGVTMFSVAAATGSEESELYWKVQESLRQGGLEFFLETEAGSLPVLRIHASEEMVEPCFHEGFTFVVEMKSFEPQVVGRYGGIFIALDDLKRMELGYDATARIIRLYEQ